MKRLRLKDIGERKLVEWLVDRIRPGPNTILPLGDDCAALSLGVGDLALATTTDPCPTPVTWLLGGRRYFDYGWYSVLINLSDLAAVGARPLGVQLSIIAPPEMAFAEFADFFAGAEALARRLHCPIVGGNLKDGREFVVDGSAFGVQKRDRLLRRGGARAGDAVCVAGETGLFWPVVLARSRGLRLPGHVSANRKLRILRPVPKVEIASGLARAGIATSCMDVSDGLFFTFQEMARRSGVDFVVDLRAFRLSPWARALCQTLDVDPLRVLRGWGEWQLVLTIPPASLRLAKRIAAGSRTRLTVVGTAAKGSGLIFGRTDGPPRPLNVIDSERFTKYSIFTHPLEKYIRLLLETPLYAG
jgi:thiamine-monophosphate kinase